MKLVHHNERCTSGRVKLSEVLSEHLHKEYSGLSALFSQVEGITIEQYFLLQRLERVKESRSSTTSITLSGHRPHRSSAWRTSAQFKKLTGMTPSAFKEMGSGRTGLDRLE